MVRFPEARAAVISTVTVGGVSSVRRASGAGLINACVGRLLGALAVVAFLVLPGAGLRAASPTPLPSDEVRSPEADCARTGEILPATYQGEAIVWTASLDGASPLSSGMWQLLADPVQGLAHVCVIEFHVDDSPDGGFIVRMPGSAEGETLERFVRFLTADPSLTFVRTDVAVGGHPAVEVVASDEDGAVAEHLLVPFADGVLVRAASTPGSGPGILESVVSSLPRPVPSLPRPAPATAPSSAVGSQPPATG